eukprot:GILK01002879.1.p1 GENE.GILK01002879.1~~GILK01002879.1.p1  ORF type:complete len:430 (+),score=48.13 GILK01002879.1:74-1363(+)
MRVGRTVVYQESHCGKMCKLVMVTILVVAFFVGVPIYGFMQELERRNMTEAFVEAAQVVEPLTSDRNPSFSNNQKLVHVHSKDLRPASVLADADFGLHFNNAWQVQRKVEYCQWQETSTEETIGRSNGKDIKRVKYYYVKSWHSHRIPSLLFNQPAAHHNPLRNPFPARDWNVNGGQIGDYYVNEALVKRMKPFTLKQYSREEFPRAFVNSNAYQQHFTYTKDGYFYGSYQKSNFERVAKLFGEYLEGSLLDFQIGDLFNICEAGDIRVRFYTVEPTEMSVLAQQSNAVGHLQEYIAHNQYKVGLLYAGKHTSDELITLEKNAQWWIVFGSRLLLLFWALMVTLILPPLEKSSITDRLLTSVFLAGFVLSSFWLVLWGNTFIASLTFAGCMFGLYTLSAPAFALYSAQRRTNSHQPPNVPGTSEKQATS